MQDIMTFIQNHLLLNLVFFATLIAVMVVEFTRQKSQAGAVNPAQLTNLINRDNPVVIDIRETEAYKQGHVIGALSMSISDLENNGRKLEKFRSRPIILVCATGTDAPRLAQKLLPQGFDARVLRGGIRAWREANMPTVKD